MRIIDIEIVPFEPSFAGDGYAMSFVIQTTLNDQLVRVINTSNYFTLSEVCLACPIEVVQPEC